MKHISVHKVNFFHPETKAIHCLSYDEPSSRLAVSRSDSSIEIWNMKGKPFIEKVLPKEVDNSVEAVTWCGGRLFSAGLHSCIIEYDLKSCSGKSVVHIGHGIWCLSANEFISAIAAGTENGSVCICEVFEHGLSLKKTVGKQEGRILCIAWHESGNYIATGSIDTIRIWDVDRDQVYERITVNRKEKNVETIIWCIAMTRDFTVITGDSSGRTSFWDGKTGTLLKSSAVHKGDVLTLCLSKDEKVVYTCGIDPLIILHEKVIVKGKEESKNRWMKSVQRQVHSHDVRALAIAGKYLISGGIDSYLIFSAYPPKTVIECLPFSELSYSSVAAEKKLLLLRYPRHLELWKFKKSVELSDGMSSMSTFEKTNTPIKLLSLKSKCDDVIICSAISSDGTWICFSTISDVRLFNVIEVKENDKSSASLLVKKVTLPEKFECSKYLAFVSSSRLVISSYCSCFILSCEVQSPRILMSFDASSYGLSEVRIISVSHCATYMACGSNNGVVLVYDLERFQVYAKLPMHEFQPTVISFDMSSTNMIVVYSDRKAVKYGLKSKICIDYCSLDGTTEFENYSTGPVKGVLFPVQDETLIMFFDEYNLYMTEDLCTVIPKKDMKKTCKREHIRIIKSYKHLLGFHQFTDGEMLAVEVKPSANKNNLPAPLWRKRYGM